MSKFIKGKNEQVLELIEKDKKEKQARNRNKVDKKFRTLPSVIPLKKLPSVRLGIDNLSIESLKQKDKEVFRSYDFKITPAELLSGIVIVYTDKTADVVLYTYKGGVHEIDNLKAVHQMYLLDESPLAVSKDVLTKKPNSDSLTVFYKVCENASQQEVFSLLFDYYKWMYNTFVAGSEEEKESQNKLTIDLGKFERVYSFLNSPQ